MRGRRGHSSKIRNVRAGTGEKMYTYVYIRSSRVRGCFATVTPRDFSGEVPVLLKNSARRRRESKESHIFLSSRKKEKKKKKHVKLKPIETRCVGRACRKRNVPNEIKSAFTRAGFERERRGRARSYRRSRKSILPAYVSLSRRKRRDVFNEIPPTHTLLALSLSRRPPPLRRAARSFERVFPENGNMAFGRVVGFRAPVAVKSS